MIPAAESPEHAALLAAGGSVFHHVVVYIKQGGEVSGRLAGDAGTAGTISTAPCSLYA